MAEPEDSIVTLLPVIMITTSQMFGVLTFWSYQLTEDARVTELVADCEMWDVLPPSRPTRKLVLACHGVDAIRLWSLPVQQQWNEKGRSF